MKSCRAYADTVEQVAPAAHMEHMMKRFGVLLALGVGLTIGAHRVIAQQPTPADLEMMKSWSMKMDTDRLTDAKVFTATATAHADDNPAHLYQLILTCDGQ